jgi:hypothetical protein
MIFLQKGSDVGDVIVVSVGEGDIISAGHLAALDRRRGREVDVRIYDQDLAGRQDKFETDIA